MRGIEFSRFFAGICGEVRDQILIDKTKNIVVLLAIHRDVFDEVYQIADCLCLASGTVSKFGKTGLQCVEDLFKNLFVSWVDQTAESRKSITDIANIEIRTLGKPCGKQILISYEVCTSVTISV